MDGKRSFGKTLDADRPDVVLLLEGANDLNHYLIAAGDADEGVTPAARALEEMVDTAHKKGIPVLLATLPPQDPEGKNGHSAGTVPKLNEAIRRLAHGDDVVHRRSVRRAGRRAGLGISVPTGYTRHPPVTTALRRSGSRRFRSSTRSRERRARYASRNRSLAGALANDDWPSESFARRH